MPTAPARAPAASSERWRWLPAAWDNSLFRVCLPPVSRAWRRAWSIGRTCLDFRLLLNSRIKTVNFMEHELKKCLKWLSSIHYAFNTCSWLTPQETISFMWKHIFTYAAHAVSYLGLAWLKKGNILQLDLWLFLLITYYSMKCKCDGSHWCLIFPVQSTTKYSNLHWGKLIRIYPD